jgi:putative ABC transport system permease protein
MIPLTYALRNIFRRPVQSIQLISGSGFVVLLIMTAMAMNESMKETLSNSGSEQNIIFLGAGSEESIERSEVAPGLEEIISSNLKGINHIMKQPAISPEVHYNGIVKLRTGHESQALIRGIKHQAFWVHHQVRLLQGRYPQSGEIIIGSFAHQKLGVSAETLPMGEELEFNGESFKIVGVFDAKGTVMEAEIWMPLYDLMTLTQRETLSCVVFSSKNKDTYDHAEVFAQTRLDLEIIALKESEYYEKLSTFYAPIRWMAWISAILISVGAFMGGLNTIYANFSSRMREFGTLQAIGFSRKAIFLSILEEAMSTGALAAITALMIGLKFIQDLSFPFAIGVFTFDFNNSVILTGIGSGVLLAICGVIPPSWKCLRPHLTQTLRSN